MSNPILKTYNKATHPSKEIYSTTKSIVIDSRQRDRKAYPDPAHYRIELDEVYKNITSVELRGISVPRTNYNVYPSNNAIDFAIGDFISTINVVNGGTGYTSSPSVTITNPVSGITATGVANLSSSGTVTSISVGIAGSGYSASKPPLIIIAPSPNGQIAIAEAVVGDHYTAFLRKGQYSIGGNPDGVAVPSGILLEIQNAMNYAVNGTYSATSTSPFEVRLVSQYPELGAVAGTPESFDTNATLFNRIQIINVNSDPWEILWCSGVNSYIAANSLMGFNGNDTGPATTIAAVGSIIPAGTAIRADNDYNLKNDPQYVILSLTINENNLDRTNSAGDEQGLDHQFAVLLFDNNVPETLNDQSGSTITTIDSVRYLDGAVTKGTFWRDSGYSKPMKGYDFDVKKINFRPPEAKVDSMTISFTTFGIGKGGSKQYYDFEGRDHILMLEFAATDPLSRQID